MKDPAAGASLHDVLPGTPEELDELIARFESYVDGATAATRGLRAMDSGGWVGDAADAFWDSVGEVTRRLDDGALAFAEAALALRGYTATLRTARVDAGRALTLFDEAERESRIWAAQQDDSLATGVAATAAMAGAGVCLADPGDALRHQARTLLAEAQLSVDAAAARAAERLHDAAEHAPNRPGWLARRWHNVTEFAGGAVEATTGMATFAFKLSPAFALINPEGFAENAKGLAEGLVFGATHPVDFAKAVVDWDTWAESPGRALGHLFPAVALAVASAGAGTAGKAAEGAGGLRAAGKATEVAEGLTTAGRGRALGELLATPKVADPKLQNYVENIYKGTKNPARVGTGTTADAVRNELATAQPTGGVFHTIKAQETVRGVERWLRRNPDASYLDRLVAQSLVDDLRDALGGSP